MAMGGWCFFSVLLAPISVAATAALSVMIGVFYGDGTVAPNSVSEISQSGLQFDRILSALLIAPLLENLMCCLLSKLIGTWNEQQFWPKPTAIAIFAASLHAILLGDLRPLAVFPGFFFIAAFIVHCQSKRVGYYVSVLHHFCINLINLSLVYFVSNN